MKMWLWEMEEKDGVVSQFSFVDRLTGQNPKSSSRF